MNKLIVVSFLLFISFVKGQELNCTVSINYERVGSTNNQIFKTLERSLNDFVNNNAWTDLQFKSSEKINCSMFITINSQAGNSFTATLQVQSSRTAFNTNYSSPMVNINDKDFNFNYVEFENLTYNPNSFDSNLMSVLAFYIYYILGVDADSYQLNGGDPYYQKAQDIVILAAPTSIAGWLQAEKRQNRYYLITDLLAQNFKPLREALFTYHFEGIDTMEKDPKSAKEIIKTAINSLNSVNSARPNAYVTRTFFDAKVDEIVSIFSGGPTIPVEDLSNTLGRISPLNSAQWSKIK